jgi:tetratricopeptide (TPR) repeat protein
VNLKIQVEEGVAEDSQSFELVDERVVELELDKETFSFQGNFTLYITPSIPEYPLLNLRIELYTIGPDFQRVFKERVVGKDEIVSLGSIRVKNGRVFKVTLIPKIMEDEERGSPCEYDLTDPDIWYSDVSVRFEYHYLKNSLADYHWNINKSYLEREFKKLEKYFNFFYPRKIDYHLCPCRLPHVTWDERFGISIDPVKNNVFVLYNQKEKTVDSPAPWFAVFYEYWGYAPAFVVEGASGCLGLGHYYAKKLKNKGEIIPLSRLQVTKDYRSYSARIAFAEASSFIRFLIDSYGTGEFKKFYQEVTDLTFDQVFEKIYLKRLSRVESEWLAFLDSYEILYDDLAYFANIEFSYNHFETSIPIFEDLLDMAETQSESLNAQQALGNSYYMSGKYEQALLIYQEKSRYYTQDPRVFNTLGNICYLLGDFKSSEVNYHKAKDLDTAYADPLIGLGKLHLILDELDSALLYFDMAEKRDVDPEGSINLNLEKAKIDKILGDSLVAQEEVKKALDFSRVFLSHVPERAVPYLKVGESFLEMGYPDSALLYLQLAEFLEDRPFYQGELFLTMGKAYHLTGEEDMARFYFEKVLDNASAVTDKKEAEKFLDELR